MVAQTSYGSCGSSEGAKWRHVGFIVKAELAGLADKLVVVSGRCQNDSKDFNLSK